MEEKMPSSYKKKKAWLYWGKLNSVSHAFGGLQITKNFGSH
jgi:hypothetical protein